jgi:hypothetical protein
MKGYDQMWIVGLYVLVGADISDKMLMFSRPLAWCGVLMKLTRGLFVGGKIRGPALPSKKTPPITHFLVRGCSTHVVESNPPGKSGVHQYPVPTVSLQDRSHQKAS